MGPGTADEVVVLGAGASADAGLPLSRELLDLAVEKVRPRLGDEGLLALHFALGALGWALGSTGRNPLRHDVEELVTLCDGLASRRVRPDAAFLPWPPLLESNPSVKLPAVFRTLRRELEVAVSEIIKSRTDLTRCSYLRPLVESRVSTIATLNFDNLVEGVAEGVEGLSLSCGIDKWHVDGQLDFGNAALRLLKLHGSVDWVHRPVPDPGAGGRRTAAFVFPSRAELLPGDTPATILGAQGKLRADGPYLELFEEFRRALWQGQTLTVIGYSFRDEHINTVLLRWLNSSRPRKMRVVTLDASGAGELGAFERWTGRVEVIRATASEVIPGYFGV